MLRASELNGRAVIELRAAEKLGYIQEVVLDPDHARMAGVVVGPAPGLFSSNKGKGRVVLESAIHAIGPDAVTVELDPKERPDDLAGLPRLSDVLGRKMVSHSGEFLGTIDEVLLDRDSGDILGYAFGGNSGNNVLGALLGRPKPEPTHNYVRGDAQLRVGKDVIVVPDESVVLGAQPPSAVGEAPATRRRTVRSGPAESTWVRSVPSTEPGGV